MDVEQLEQIAAVVVTAGLVAGNFLMFTPWRNGDDPRRQHPERSILQNDQFIKLSRAQSWFCQKQTFPSVSINAIKLLSTISQTRAESAA